MRFLRTLAPHLLLVVACSSESNPLVPSVDAGNAMKDAGDAGTPALPWSGAAEVDAVANASLETDDLVGLAVGVASTTGVLYTHGYGFEDRESAIPVDPAATLFRWASVSKTATATITAQLVTEKKVDLDAPIQTYLPSYPKPTAYLEPCVGATFTNARGTFPCTSNFADVPLLEAERTLTPRLLAAHLGGIPHYANGRDTPQPPEAFLTDPGKNKGMETALPMLSDKALVAIPTTKFSYSSFGFNLLGVLLEKAAGAPFAELFETRINTRAGTHIKVDDEFHPLPRRAVGYLKSGSKVVRDGSTDVSWKVASGGLISTVNDFALYCGALLGNALLTPAEKELLWKTQKTAGGSSTNFALGFYPQKRNGKATMAHSGGQEKTATMLSLYVDQGLCVVTMTNSAYADIGAISEKIEAAVLSAEP